MIRFLAVSRITGVLTTVGWAAIACSPADSAATASWDDPPERWQLVQELEVGVVDGPEEYALTHVGDVTVDDAGHLYSLHGRQEMRVRVFGPDGGFVRWIGAQGGGPGEFRRPIRMGWQGDRLWVFDLGSQRISIFDRDGRLSDEVAASPPHRGDLQITPYGLLGEGTIIGVASARGRPPRIEPLDSVPVVGWSEGGSSVDTLAVLDQSNRILQFGPFGAHGTGTITGGGQPFLTTDMWTVAPDGATLVIVQRSTPGEIRALRLSADGDTVEDRVHRHQPREIPAAAIEGVLDRWTDALVNRGIDRREARAHVIERVHVPEHLPPVSSLMAATDGRLWLGRWEDPQEMSPRRYTVLGSDGDIAAVAEVPEGVRLLAAADDHAWGVREDELDVPYLVRLRIERDSNRD